MKRSDRDSRDYPEEMTFLEVVEATPMSNHQLNKLRRLQTYQVKDIHTCGFSDLPTHQLTNFLPTYKLRKNKLPHAHTYKLSDV